MSSSLDLSKQLRATTDEHLSSLIRIRIPHPQGLKDYFDVADALLSTESLTTALEQLTGPELAELGSDLSSRSPELAEFLTWNMLTHSSTGELYPEVLALAATTTVAKTTATTKRAVPVTGAHARAALERSVALISTLDELGREISRQPAKTTGKGALSAPDALRLGALCADHLHSIDDVLALANQMGIVTHTGSWWLATDALTPWLELDSASRWMAAATSWRESVAPAIKQVLLFSPNVPPETSWLEHRFPLGASWVSAPLAQTLSFADMLGLISQSQLTQIAVDLLENKTEAVMAALSEAVPPTVDSVFIQHDYTIVASGPLSQDIDRFIRSLCVVESRGVASTFRITSDGIDSLLSQGMSGDEIVQSLRAYSSTPMPQAVEYLISDRAERFGSIVVVSEELGCVVSARDELIATTLVSDRNLRALGLSSHTTTQLYCAHPGHVVVRALRDAKYPAVLHDATGQIITALPTPRAVTITSTTDHVSSVMTRLRTLVDEHLSDDKSWIGRQIELAVREKSVIIVTVDMPDGQKELTVEVKSMANGRLRCLDRTTEVERTLPLSHIVAVRQG